MSPLIATVLLIAFAVALGAMIMNWGTNGVVEGPVDVNSVCSSVRLQSNGLACFADNKLTFNLENTGREKVNAVKIKYSVTDFASTASPADTSMIVGESLSRSIPFLYDGGEISLEFIPVIYLDELDSENMVECPAIVQSTLPDC